MISEEWASNFIKTCLVFVCSNQNYKFCADSQKCCADVRLHVSNFQISEYFIDVVWSRGQKIPGRQNSTVHSWNIRAETEIWQLLLECIGYLVRRYMDNIGLRVLVIPYILLQHKSVLQIYIYLYKYEDSSFYNAHIYRNVFNLFYVSFLQRYNYFNLIFWKKSIFKLHFLMGCSLTTKQF